MCLLGFLPKLRCATPAQISTGVRVGTPARREFAAIRTEASRPRLEQFAGEQQTQMSISLCCC